MIVSDENKTHESPEFEHNTVNAELAACTQERDSWKEKFLYLQADFDNVTKRTIKERAQWTLNAQSGVLTDILPIIDDFDRAFAELAKKSAVDQSNDWVAGFQLIYKALQKMLDKYEVVEISGTIPFDPSYHEAIVSVAAPDVESGAIVAVLQKGYTYKGQVLRPAKVSVAQ